MLAERGIPRSLDGWAAEPKLDGWRARVLADDGQVRLRTRSGRDISASVRPIERLTDRWVVLDGELVAEAGTMTNFYAVGPGMAADAPSRSSRSTSSGSTASCSPATPSRTAGRSSTGSTCRSR